MLNVMRFWMDLGLDGFRADAVPYLFEEKAPTARTSRRPMPSSSGSAAYSTQSTRARILLAEANQWPADLRALL